MAWPMPRLAPVTIATFLSSLPMVIYSECVPIRIARRVAGEDSVSASAFGDAVGQTKKYRLLFPRINAKSFGKGVGMLRKVIFGLAILITASMIVGQARAQEWSSGWPSA